MASEVPSILSELAPIGLNELSRRLGVDPFESVRLLVATGHDLGGPLVFPAQLVEELRERGGVDASWWVGVELPADPHPGRARVRGMLQMMLERGLVGERTTRMDNLWRGLAFDDQAVLQRAVSALTAEGLLYCVGTVTGLQVSVEASKKSAVEALARGKGSSAGLTAIFEG